jgi:hypothetical protein
VENYRRRPLAVRARKRRHMPDTANAERLRSLVEADLADRSQGKVP